jgi:hypothetical protein
LIVPESEKFFVVFASFAIFVVRAGESPSRRS